MSDDKVKSTKEQIDEMLDSMSHNSLTSEDGSENKDEKKTDSDSDSDVDKDKDKGKTDSESDEDGKPKESKKSDDDEKGSEEEESKEKTEEKVDKTKELAPTPKKEVEVPNEEVETLKAKVNELSTLVKTLQKPPAKPEEKPSEELVPVPTIADMNFLDKDLDVEEVIRNPEEFNKLLNKIAKTIIEVSRKSTTEGVLRSIPEIVKRTSEANEALKKEAELFYENNEDLRPFGKVVSLVFEESLSDHPEWKFRERMDEAAKEVRKRLSLPVPAKTSQKSEGKSNETDKADKSNEDKADRHSDKPHFPPGSRGAKRSSHKPETNELLNEIDAMNKV